MDDKDKIFTMAIWHFNCSLVPKKWLDHDVGRHLINRPTEKPNFEAAWRTRNEEFSIIEFCDSRFTRVDPDEKEVQLQMLRWDCDNGNEILVAIGHGAVTGVTALIDTRQAYGEFSTTLLELSVLTGCLLHFDDSGRIVEPVMETLVAAIGGSEAARAARDPGTSEQIDSADDTPVADSVEPAEQPAAEQSGGKPTDSTAVEQEQPLHYANIN